MYFIFTDYFSLKLFFSVQWPPVYHSISNVQWSQTTHLLDISKRLSHWLGTQRLHIEFTSWMQSNGRVGIDWFLILVHSNNFCFFTWNTRIEYPSSQGCSAALSYVLTIVCMILSFKAKHVALYLYWEDQNGIVFILNEALITDSWPLCLQTFQK